jgi:hypothetical protein
MNSGGNSTPSRLKPWMFRHDSQFGPNSDKHIAWMLAGQYIKRYIESAFMQQLRWSQPKWTAVLARILQSTSSNFEHVWG